MKAYFIGGPEDLTVKVISRAPEVFNVHARYLAAVKMGEDLLAPTANFDVHTYRLRAKHGDVVIYMHEDLLQ